MYPCDPAAAAAGNQTQQNSNSLSVRVTYRRPCCSSSSSIGPPLDAMGMPVYPSCCGCLNAASAAATWHDMFRNRVGIVDDLRGRVRTSCDAAGWRLNLGTKPGWMCGNRRGIGTEGGKRTHNTDMFYRKDEGQRVGQSPDASSTA